ncbi:CDP-alcohol phosphatidyltransferase family protein [Arthrobacter sp. CAN_C5]|uniref:CDP-alcohol phosphatidyltransferase family protein n=1 Tax=Arthrobacter sp. CAN_C5 TaxID=2760706 RepID=UPI001AE4BC64|nr:CDP-alcohol phosphatidyltransferase family protein [Arthrobacter sp. CAN_C5]MBP2216285.1 phosphatidylglycerophosphate synthase [Arthrobacter sp. CAN_C5]
MARVSKRALFDASSAVLGSAGIGITLLALNDSHNVTNLAAVVAGLTLVTVAALSVVRRRPSYSGPADRVTLLRAVLAGGCATIVVLSLWGDVPTRSWWLVLLAAPAVLLDAVDGAVARRTGTASPAGARLDMETDAILLLVLSIPVALTVGWWALLIGLMRYLYVAASWFRPVLRVDLEFSQFRRVVAATQGVVLVVILVPLTPVALAVPVAAASLLLLAASFGRDVVALERSARALSS